jgi:chromate transporter
MVYRSPAEINFSLKGYHYYLEPHSDTTPSRDHRLGELAKLVLRLGFTAFGGPAAHIAMLHDEVVNRRKWITEEHFLDLLGATNLIPGPNSTEW